VLSAQSSTATDTDRFGRRAGVVGVVVAMSGAVPGLSAPAGPQQEVAVFAAAASAVRKTRCGARLAITGRWLRCVGGCGRIRTVWSNAARRAAGGEQWCRQWRAAEAGGTGWAMELPPSGEGSARPGPGSCALEYRGWARPSGHSTSPARRGLRVTDVTLRREFAGRGPLAG